MSKESGEFQERMPPAEGQCDVRGATCDVGEGSHRRTSHVARRTGAERPLEARLFAAWDRNANLNAALVHLGQDLEASRADVAELKREVARLEAERDQLLAERLDLRAQAEARLLEARARKEELDGLRQRVAQLGLAVEIMGQAPPGEE